MQPYPPPIRYPKIGDTIVRDCKFYKIIHISRNYTTVERIANQTPGNKTSSIPGLAHPLYVLLEPVMGESPDAKQP